MGLGGINAGWNNNSPANTDSAGLGDDEIRSLKTSVQQVLDSEHNFPVGGGAGTGYHRYGSARPYVAPTASAISSDGTDGRLTLNATDGSLWGSQSATSVGLIGHPFLLFNGSSAISSGVSSLPKFGNMIGSGVTKTGTSGIAVFDFPGSGYSGLPLVIATPYNTSTGGQGKCLIVTVASARSGRVDALNGDGSTAVGVQFAWISIGTVSLGVA